MATTVADLKVKFSADGADKTKRDITDLGNAVDGANGRMGGFRSTLLGTFGGMLSYNMFTGMAGGLKDLGMGFISANSQLENFRSQLETATGSAEKADAVLENMRSIAATSPFEFPELADAARVLESFGVSSQKWIPTIGNTAAATGKSIDQVTQALLDAQTGEFERLKELGIRTEVEGDRVRFSFMKNGQMMTVEAENTQEGIENALMGIWDDKYDGAMDRMSDTWTGKLANLKDNVGMMLQDAGKPIFELAKAGVGLANEWFDAFNGFRTKGLSPINAGIAALGSVITAHLGAKAGAAFQKFATGAINAFDRVKNIVGDVAETIGDVLGGAFEFLVDHGDMVVGALKGIGVAFAGLATAAAVFAVVGGAIALVTSPLFILMAAAAALGVAWQTNFLGIRDITATVVDFLVGAFNTVKDAIQFIMDGFDTGGWAEAWERVKHIASAAWDGIKTLVTDAFDSIRDTISNVDWGAVWNTLVAGAQAAIGWVLDAIRNVDWGALVQGGWDVIQSGIALAWDAITSIKWSDFVPDLVWDGFVTAVNLAKKVGAFAWDAFVTAVDLAEKVGDFAWDAFVTAVDLAAKVGDFAWDAFVTAVDLAKKVLDLSWSDFVPDISWGDFIPDLEWPSPSDILNAMGLGGLLGGSGSGTDSGANTEYGDSTTRYSSGGGGGGMHPGDRQSGLPGNLMAGSSGGAPIPYAEWSNNGGALDSLIASLNAARDAIVSFVSESIALMGGWTTGIQTQVNSAADTLRERASGSTAGAKSSFITFVADTIGVMGGWTTGIQTIVNSAADALRSRASGATASAKSSFVTFVADTIGVMGGWTSGIQNMVNTTMDALKSRTSGATAGAKSSMTTFAADTSSAIRSWASTVSSSAQKAMSDLVSAVRNGMSQASGSIRSESGTWAGIINGAAGAMGAAGYNAGAAAGFGVANGLRSAHGSVAAAAADIIATVDAAMRKAGEIKSPSRLTGRVGKELTRGVAFYMTSSDVMRDLQRAAGAVIGTVDGAMGDGVAGLSYGTPGLSGAAGGRAYQYAATGTGRAVTIQNTFTITQREGEDGEALAQRVVRMLETDFDDVGGLTWGQHRRY